MLDFTLLVQIGLVLGIAKHGLLKGVGGIIAIVHAHLSGFDLHDFGNHLIQEITVVGNDKYGSWIVEKIGFQPGNALHIQMVGRLIQKQDVRLGNQKLAKSHTGFLTT